MNAGPAPFAIVGAAVLDGTGGPVLPGGRTVLVRDGRIAQVGPAGAVAVPSGVRVVDGTGLVVLPGFVDTHVHLDFYPAAEVLRGGVTTVRDLGWPAGRLAVLREEAERSPASSPRLLAAGQIVTAPGGYPSHAAWAPAGTAREVDGPDQAAAAAADLAAAGASVVKVALDARVGPTLPAETLAAAVRAAGGCASSWPPAATCSTAPTSATRVRHPGWTWSSWRCWSRPASPTPARSPRPRRWPPGTSACGAPAASSPAARPTCWWSRATRWATWMH